MDGLDLAEFLVGQVLVVTLAHQVILEFLDSQDIAAYLDIVGFRVILEFLAILVYRVTQG